MGGEPESLRKWNQQTSGGGPQTKPADSMPALSRGVEMWGAKATISSETVLCACMWSSCWLWEPEKQVSRPWFWSKSKGPCTGLPKGQKSWQACSSSPTKACWIAEDQRVRARQPRTYAAHLHEDTSPSAQHQAPRGMQAGRYERPLPPKEQHWNGNPAGDGGEGREGHEDRRERKSRKKQKKEKLKEKLKKHHRREQGKERRRRRGGSADDSPMHVGPSGHKGQPPRQVSASLHVCLQFSRFVGGSYVGLNKPMHK